MKGSAAILPYLGQGSPSPDSLVHLSQRHQLMRGRVGLGEPKEKFGENPPGCDSPILVKLLRRRNFRSGPTDPNYDERCFQGASSGYVRSDS